MSHLGQYRNLSAINPSIGGRSGQFLLFDKDSSEYINRYTQFSFLGLSDVSEYTPDDVNMHINVNTSIGNVSINLPQPSPQLAGGQFLITKTSSDINYIEINCYPGSRFVDFTTQKHIYKRGECYNFVLDATYYSPIIDSRSDRAVIKVGQIDSTGHNFRSIKDAADWINNNNLFNATIRILPGTYYITSPIIINNDYTTTIIGDSPGMCTIEPSTNMIGHPLFICNSDTNFYRLNIFGYNVPNYGLSASENAIIFLNEGGYSEIEQCDIDTFYTGIQIDASGMYPWIFNSYVSNCSSVGCFANLSHFITSETEFTNCNTSIELYQGSNVDVNIQNSIFTMSQNQTGIKYDGSTYSYASMFVTPNIFKGDSSVNKLVGFDFSMQRDSNIVIYPNAGLEEYSTFGYCLVTNNAIDTSVNTQSIKPLITANDARSRAIKMGLGIDRLTYYPNAKGFLKFNISGSVFSRSPNRTATISLVKNASYGAGLVAETDLRLTTAAQPYPFSISAADFSVGPNDFYEVWFKDGAGAVNYRLTELQFLAFE